jgi:cytochrome c-type biogenesis protein CcmH/NrfG
VEGLERGGNKESINGNLIKEVVAVEKKKNTSSENDDDLGVDRKILEKKLINKIAQNPKDIENYRQLGELYLKMENYSDSLDCYKQVLKFKTRDVDAKRKIERINLLKRFK